MSKLLMIFVLFSSVSFAQPAQQRSVDVSKLTEEQRQAVQAVANQMAEKKSDAADIINAIQSVDKDKVRGWAEAGTEAGRAVTNFAREIGIVASEFLNSFVGKATFLLVFMNYGGGKLAQFGFNVIAFVVLTPVFLFFMWKVFKRFVLQVVTTVEKKSHPNLWWRFVGLNEVTIKTDSVKYQDETFRFWTPVIGWAFILGSSLLYFINLWPRW